MFTLVDRSLKQIGYRDHLIKPNYRYAAFGSEVTARNATLAAFAQEPPSALTACIGVTNDSTELRDLRYLGAPLILEISGRNGRRWQSTPDDLVRLDRTFKPLPQLFETYREEWKPERIFRAKSVGAFEKAAQLDFVDLGLLPAIESEARQKLDGLIRKIVVAAQEAYANRHGGEHPPESLLFRLLFNLITAKVLYDTNVLPNLDFSSPYSVLHAVQLHNKSEPLVSLDEAMLAEASSRIAASFPFSNITADTLAFVYENTLVSEATRKELSVHPTPPYLAEYMLSRLPLNEMNLDSIRVADPMCGHGTFLTAALKRLRTLLPMDWSPEARHAYLLKHIAGQDVDPFSVEVARLSLTLADLPHPNGWQIRQGDTYAPGVLETIAADTTVFLTNPPFESFHKEEISANSDMQSTKAAELLVRALRSLPDNALIGVVMPLSFLNGRSYREARDLLASSYRIYELLTLPDNVFGRSDTESSLVLAQKCPQHISKGIYNIAYRGVRKDALDVFANSGTLSRDDTVSSSDLLDKDRLTATGFWIPSLYSVWSALSHNPRLASIAEIHRGVEYGSKLMKEHRELIVQDEPFPDSALGIDSVGDQLYPFLVSKARWLSTKQEHRRGGAWNLPWSKPKILVNAARQSRGPWRLIAAGDTSGLLATQRFHAIWPRNNEMIYLLTALLNSAFANAFVSEHEGQRDNRKRTLDALPLPNDDHPALEAVTVLSKECYRRVADDPNSDLTTLLVEIDAQLLMAYDLRPRDERRLLDLFSGTERPAGLSFAGFFPADFTAAVPLHTYLSSEFRQASAERLLTNMPEFDDPVISEMLTDLREAS